MNKTLVSFTMIAIICSSGADYQNKNRPNFPQNRTGLSYRVGDTAVTKRSDGSSSNTRPFGKDSITVERLPNGKTITGHTYKFGNGTKTQWSDGKTTYSRPFGNGAIVTESHGGKTNTGIVTPYGNGSVTKWNNGTTNTNRNFGNGSINTDRK